ncbi:NUDIX hydrolase [Myceligenerans crystallogenes]|uniref:Nudix hydrolase domain-containing protein n=1 Tax=Myceligenerans crystallogenes TaxID=316335 RepID=A0ABN2NM07_9MICO
MRDSEGITNSLGPDWRVAPDGVRERDAARVILLDGDGRALLLRSHDVDQPERSWWFTLGGGIDPGETPVEAALREVREEAGLVLSPDDLEGPVLTRSALFDFYAETCRQHEVFFLARVSAGALAFDRSGWTAIERETIDDLAWLGAADLRAQPLEVFPHELPEILDDLAAGWDGRARHLGPQRG